MGIFSNLDVMWEEPRIARFLGRLASFSRLTLFDMRGVGLSDRGSARPILERQRDDLAAVMDAVGVERGVVFGVGRAATMSLLFAATHPERTEALILYAMIIKTVATADFPHGKSADDHARFLDRFVEEMGTGRNLDLQAPSLTGDDRFVNWWARFERLVAKPAAYRELAGIMTDLDVADVLPVIHVPTLLLHRQGDRVVPVGQARHAAGKIPGVRYVELAGEDHLPFAGDSASLLDEVEEFVTGAGPAPRQARVLATALFTDMVDSTSIQVRLGDRAWRQLLEEHHEVVRRHIGAYGGVEQDTAGDGFFVRFDGPARAVECATEIVSDLAAHGIAVRAGIHTGECEISDGKCTGLAVSIAARIMAKAGPGEILVSQTVKDLTAGGGLRLEEMGEHELKGVPDRWRLYRVAANG